MYSLEFLSIRFRISERVQKTLQGSGLGVGLAICDFVNVAAKPKANRKSQTPSAVLTR